MMTLIYELLAAHFVADFLCQTDWMALNKSKRWDALALHVAVYSAVVCLCLAVVSLFNELVLSRVVLSPREVLPWLAINGAAHFVQDAITSRINARLWQANERHWFFIGIGFDQLLHYVTLFATAEWLLR